MHDQWGMRYVLPVKRRTGSVFLLALCATGVSVAAELAVTLDTHGSMTIPAERVLRLVCDTGDQALVFDLGPDRRISVPDVYDWLGCRIDEKDIWSRSAQPTLIGESIEITIDLWPAAEVRGWTVEPEVFEDIPMQISVSGSIDGSIEPLGSRDCMIGADGSFGCPVPAARALDAKIRLTGHISHFLWGLDTTTDIDLGERRFRPGASVIGRVEIRGLCDDPQSPVVVRLVPLLSGWKNSKQEDRLKRQATAVETGRQGFFHLDGVQAGKYTVSAEQTGCGLAQMSPVTVYPQAETTLREPLVLTLPGELEILVEPPVDPWGEEWKAELVHITPVSGTRKFLGDRKASTAGIVRFEGLSRGPYRVSIVDSEGSSWAVQPVEVEMALERVEIALDLVELTGSVLSGDDAIEADLIFGGSHGSVSIRTFSDVEGRFLAVLPHEGEWPVDIVGLNTPIRRTLPKVDVYDGADVTLRIGDGALSGRVIDEEGRPFPGAAVSVVMVDDSGSRAETSSGEDGYFKVGGLERGKVVVRAEWEALSADEKERDLSAKDADDVELVLEDRGLYILTVVRGGWPVPGARAQHVVTTAAGIAMRGYTADLDGRIEIPLKPGTDRGSAVVIAQGAPVQLISLDRYQSPLTVSLDGIGGSLSIPVTTFSILKFQGAMCPLPFFSAWSNIMQVHQIEDLLTIGPMAAGFYEACQGPAAGSVCKGETLQNGVAITLE